MPKQASLFKIRGKSDGNSFFYSPNGGYQFRKINPNMSERVKTEEGFVNTRRNAAEFGAAGSCAAAICRSFYQSFRFVATKKLPGELTKLIDSLIRSNSEGVWGQRRIPLLQMPLIQQRFNMLMKNPFPQFIKNHCDTNIYWDSANDQIVGGSQLVTTAEFEQEWLAKGANGLTLLVFIMGATNPAYDSSVGKYVPCVANQQQQGVSPMSLSIDGTGGHVLLNTFRGTTTWRPFNTTAHISGMLYVFMPYRQTGTQASVLQDLCSAYWAEPKEDSE